MNKKSKNNKITYGMTTKKQKMTITLLFYTYFTISSSSQISHSDMWRSATYFDDAGGQIEVQMW